ncbi:hypothetical protein CBM2626_A140288 [Cupriavidus taiwanensis]|nr:hypothetical protein CBM2626_A140288 [Cupriavidus taiwanensis]
MDAAARMKWPGDNFQAGPPRVHCTAFLTAPSYTCHSYGRIAFMETGTVRLQLCSDLALSPLTLVARTETSTSFRFAGAHQGIGPACNTSRSGDRSFPPFEPAALAAIP